MMLPGEAKSQMEKVDCCVYYTLCCDMGLHQQITWHLKSLQTAESIPWTSNPVFCASPLSLQNLWKSEMYHDVKMCCTWVQHPFKCQIQEYPSEILHCIGLYFNHQCF